MLPYSCSKQRSGRYDRCFGAHLVLLAVYSVCSCAQRSYKLERLSTMTHSSSSSSGSESEGHQKRPKKEKKDKKDKKDKKEKKEKKEKKDKQKHKPKDEHHKSKHGEYSGLNVLGVVGGVHKLEGHDHEHGGSRPAQVPAASVNLQYPHVLGTTNTTMLLPHDRQHDSTHGVSSIGVSVGVSGHSNRSVAQSSGFSLSGNRVPLKAGDRLPSLHETGPAPFLDADGGPVFLGSALFGRSVHPCKIVPNVRDSETFDTLLHMHNNAVTSTLPCALQW